MPGKRTTWSTRSRSVPAGCAAGWTNGGRRWPPRQSRRSAAACGMPKGTMEQLESLGYVGGGGSSDAESGADLKLEDPKDFVPVFEHCQAGTELSKAASLPGGQERVRTDGLGVPEIRPGAPLSGRDRNVAIARGRGGTRGFDRAEAPDPVQGRRPPPGRHSSDAG